MTQMTGLYSTKGIIYYLDRNDRRGDRILRSHHISLTETSPKIWGGGAKKPGVVNRICYPLILFLLSAWIHNIHSTRTLQRSKTHSETESPESIPISLGGGTVALISPRRMAVFHFHLPLLPHPLKQYLNSFY